MCVFLVIMIFFLTLLSLLHGGTRYDTWVYTIDYGIHVRTSSSILKILSSNRCLRVTAGFLQYFKAFPAYISESFSGAKISRKAERRFLLRRTSGAKEYCLALTSHTAS